MKRNALLIAALALCSSPGSAFAADMPAAPPPLYNVQPAPVFNWTGFYFGGHLGYGKADRTNFEADGFTGGLQTGFNWQVSPNWVFGIEGDISGTDMNTLAAGVPVHFDYLATLRGRLGYSWDNILLYGTFGWAYGRMGSLGVHVTDAGYALGAGIEWAYSRAWSAKLEYVYYEFGDGFSMLDTTMQTVKFGVNYRFGL